MLEFEFLRSLLGLSGPLYFGKPNSGPTQQQQALATEQATTTANQNLEENEQRKIILNAMQGTRVFRGSALSRSIASNRTDTVAPSSPAPSSTQQNGLPITAGAGTSLLDIAGGTSIPGIASAASAAAGRGNAGGRGAGGNR